MSVGIETLSRIYPHTSKELENHPHMKFKTNQSGAVEKLLSCDTYFLPIFPHFYYLINTPSQSTESKALTCQFWNTSKKKKQKQSINFCLNKNPYISRLSLGQLP